MRRVRGRQKGTVILTVMMVTLLIMFMASGLVNAYHGIEVRAIESNLAEARLYWAMHGQLDHMLSAIRYRKALNGLCGTGVACVDDAERLTNVNTVLGPAIAAPADGLTTDGTTKKWTWTYPGYTSYQIVTQALQAFDEGGDDDGAIKVRFTLDSLIMPGLTGSGGSGHLSRALDMEVVVCTSQTVAGDACPPTATDDTSSHVKVSRFRRVDPDSAWP
ncbi:MAG: hypothetical protein HQL40_01640 [Alphaproteobacteria bacterium]|nr:hypothetical protein [Alphaproteobacteria bacterium]